MQLTPYDEEKFAHLDKLPMNSWFKIDPNRSDISDFMSCLNKYQLTWGTLVTDELNHKFKKVYRPETILYCKQHNIEL